MSAKFEGILARNLQFGHVLEVCAKCEHDGSWFNITLALKNRDDDTRIEVGLQILVYIHNNMIAFKRANDEWKEEFHHEFANAIFLNEFKLNIVLGEQHFHIAINGRPCSMISYGMPLNLLNTIRISGHLEYIKQVDHRKYFPSSWPPIQIPDDRLNFSNDQPMSFRPGHVMVIRAQLFGNDRGRFILQFRNARNNKRQEFHASIRFDTRTIVRNAKTEKRKVKRSESTYLDFGDEESDGGFPFDDFSRPFTLAIAFTETALKFAKDGHFFCKFYFRTPNVLSDIMGLKIFGTDSVTVRVSGVDHITSTDELCTGFEYYSGNNF